MVGGAAMYPSRDIIQNAVNSKDHTTLVAAVKAAALVATLELLSRPIHRLRAHQRGVRQIAPPGNRRDAGGSPKNKALLTKILTYHVVAGRLDPGADLVKMVKDGHGRAMLTTVEGDKLTISQQGGQTDRQR